LLAKYLNIHFIFDNYGILSFCAKEFLNQLTKLTGFYKC
jgi:hypothetical protein